MDTNISFEKIVDALLDADKPFPAKYLHIFSDLSSADTATLQKSWQFIPEKRKVTWLEDLEDISDADTTTSFFEVGKLALKDALPATRELGIRLLWESEDRSLIRIFTDLLNNDPDISVQAAAASAMGRFIFLGEMEELPAKTQADIEQLLIEKFAPANPPLLRRRAIESLGFSSNPDMDELILQAYNEPDNAMKASALFAMGHSANDAWKDIVLSNLDNPTQEMQLEAVRAAGELELQDARDLLLEIVEDEGLDQDVFLAAIWSLSQIGGEGVQQKLDALADDPDLDDETIDLIDSAIENLTFNISLGNFSLLDLEDEDDKDE